jgi:uncharacterized membrane protein YfcA
MDAEILVAAFLIAMVAASVQSTTGFGFALVMAPLLAVLWEPKAAVPATLLLALSSNVLVLSHLRGNVTRYRLPGLYLGLVMGIPLGVLFLEQVNADVLQVTVGVVVFSATILLYFAPEIDTGRDSLPMRVGAGMIGGVLSSATSMGGPPVVLYLLGREDKIDSYRATLLAYFLLAGALALAGLIVVGRVDLDVLTVAAASFPAVILGSRAGLWLRSHLDPERFRRVVVGVLIATSISVTVLAIVG